MFGLPKNAAGNGQDYLLVYNGSQWSSVGSITLGSTLLPIGAPAATSIAGLSSVASLQFDVGNAGEVRFFEATANGAYHVSLEAPANVASSVTFVLPGADGSAGQVLTTDGSGKVSSSSSA